MSDILSKIKKDMFQATKDHDELTKGITQMVLAAAKNLEIDSGEELNDEAVIALIRKEVKKLKDSIEQFTAGDRKDLAEESQKQMDYLSPYLPQLMSAEEIEKVVAQKIEETGAESMRDMGRLMGTVMGELKGKADGGMVKDAVQKLLS